MFSYFTLYEKTVKGSLNLQFFIQDDGFIYIWIGGTNKNESNTTVIPLDGRCPCTNNIL